MTDNRFRKGESSWGIRPEPALPSGVGPEGYDDASVLRQGGRASAPEGGEHANPAEAVGDASGEMKAQSTPAGGETAQTVGEAGPAEAQASAETTGPAETQANDLTQELERLRAELAATRDQLLRAYAELDNFRKRVARQLEEERRYSELALLRDLLPVLDDIYRAVEAANTEASPASLKEGFRMVAEHLEQVLARHNCHRIEAEGQPFDPNVHEAVAQEPSDSCPPNTVVRVLRTGYRLHDRVVRPAQVVVSLGSAPAPANN